MNILEGKEKRKRGGGEGNAEGGEGVATQTGVSVGNSGSNLSAQIHFGHPAKITESAKGGKS